MRYIYNIMFYFILPLLVLRLFWKSRKLASYRHRITERFGLYPFRLSSSIWVHCVSVGETIAAAPLINTLKEQYPGFPLVVTTMTPTGAEQVKKLFGASVKHVYVPYDFSGAVKRFLKTMRPKVAIIMETELWPNKFHYCSKQHIPICILNARLSEKSYQGYKKIKWLARDMLGKVVAIGAHAEQDAERFVALGADREKVLVTGSIKFDLQLPLKIIEQVADLRDMLGKERFIWIAASTHEGEEEVILRAHRKIRAFCLDALLVLVPRHPDRFEQIAKLCSRSFNTARRSLQQTCTADTAVYLGDTMGELLLLYGAADVTFVGGSLIARGGHNLLEPAALAKPILSGPHVFNFKEISRLLAAKQALIYVEDSDCLSNEVIKLYHHPGKRKQIGENAKAVLDANKGALAKQVGLVERVL